MLEKIIYIPYMNSDTVEGRGPIVPCTEMNTIIGCSTMALARIIADKKDRVMGQKPNPKYLTVKTCRVIEGLADLERFTHSAKVDKALAKLTDEDKALLGLTIGVKL